MCGKLKRKRFTGHGLPFGFSPPGPLFQILVQGLNRDWAHLDALLVGEFRANRLQAHGLYFFFWGLLLFGKSSQFSVSARC